jgi:hypothetical protein
MYLKINQMKKLELIQTETYERNLEKGGNLNPCARCGKEVKNEKYSVHLIEGGNTILAKADEDKYNNEAADMGWYPIGGECAKHIPKEFLYIK